MWNTTPMQPAGRDADGFAVFRTGPMEDCPMPRPRSESPSPEAEEKRRQRNRRRLGLVAVSIGSDVFDVSERLAKRFRSAAEAEAWVRDRENG